MTQRVLAERVPCSAYLISRIERSVQDPNLQFLCLLVGILEVMLNDFCDRETGFGNVTPCMRDNGMIDGLLLFCRTPRTKREMMAFCGLSSEAWFRKKILYPLLADGLLSRTIPDKPSRPEQRYAARESWK